MLVKGKKMNIKNYLKKKKMSVKEFSKLISVPKSSIYHYISGTRTPHIGTAVHIEKITRKQIKVRDLIK